MRERDIVSSLLLLASKINMRLWRNNCGAAYDPTGNFIRYGLANESSKMNKIIKSGDLIGIKPVLITPDLVGKTIGQFVSIEAKRPGWIFKNTEHERAQLNWINLIESLGGEAYFSTGEIILNNEDIRHERRNVKKT